MKIYFRILLLFIFCTFSIIAQAQEKGQLDLKNCSLFDAVYKPHNSYDSGDLQYEIHVQNNPNYIAYTTPKLFFFLDVFSKDAMKKTSRLKLDYICSGGSIPKCWLSFGNKKQYELYIVGINLDFSRQNIGRHNIEAPEALIIPNTAAVFNYVDWSNVKSIKYFNQNKTHPTFSVPEIWSKNCF